MRYPSAGLALIVIGAVAACTTDGSGSPGASYPMSGGSGRTAGYIAPTVQAPMDQTRRIAEQDCTKPVDLDRGNLLCR